MHRSIRSPIESRGYTLIELVVVLLIIGITLSIVIPRLTIPDHDGQLVNHTHNIRTLIQLTKNESIIRGQIMGLAVRDNTLRVLRLKKGKWEALTTDTTFKAYRLPKPFDISLRTDKLPFASTEDKKSIVMILPDGQINSFEITLFNTQTQEQQIITDNTDQELAVSL